MSFCPWFNIWQNRELTMAPPPEDEHIEPPFDFLGLPREMRNAIHELTLRLEDCKPLELQTDSRNKHFEHPHVTITSKPNINWMLASKQIQQEYSDTVKKHTTVDISTNGTWDLSRLEAWLPAGVTLALVKELQSWTVRLAWVSWTGSAARLAGLYSFPKNLKLEAHLRTGEDRSFYRRRVDVLIGQQHFRKYLNNTQLHLPLSCQTAPDSHMK